MPSNFYYAAYSYLDEWMAKDREFCRLLATDGICPEHVERRECLVEVATYYGVIRTLQKRDDEPRLNAA